MTQSTSIWSRAPRVTVVLASLAALLCACGSPEARRASHMRRGEQYLHDRNFTKARIEFRNVLQLAPGDITARVRLGQIAEREGSFSEAFSAYRAAVDIDPENPAARACLARIYVFANEPETALELVEPALLRYPNDPDLLTVRGSARQELQDTAEAFQDARRAVRLGPTNENAVALLASLFMRNGEGPKAIELLQSTLKAIPASIDVREILASAYLSLDEPQLAEAQLLEIVKIAPRDVSQRLKLAQFYEQRKRLQDAERVLKQAVADLSHDDAAKLAYVEFVTRTRSLADGERILAQFIDRDPRDYDLQLGFGALRQKSGNINGALATYRRIIENAGERPQALDARNRTAAILVASGHADEALALVSEVLEKSPRDSDALIMRGNIELERDDPPAAIADLRAVLRAQPDDVPILRTLARAHLANGEPALADENLRDALKAAPRNVAVRLDLAQLLIQSNRYPAAVAILEETVLEAPQSVEAREALARAYLASQQWTMAGHATEDLKLVAPKSAIGWYLGGLLAADQHRPDDARSQLEQGLRLEPKAIDLTAALIRLDVSSNRPAQAMERAAASVAAQPDNPVAHEMLGELYLSNKDYPHAIEQLTRATQLGPHLWLPYRNLAIAQIGSGDLRAGTHTYETAVATVGRNANLIIDLAALYERQGRVEEAIKLYRDTHDHKPRLLSVANNLAMLLVTYRKDAASLNEAQELTGTFERTDDPSLLDTEGWVSFKCGKVAQALQDLGAAAVRQPKSQVIRYHLGMAELEAKQFAKARTDLEAALEGGQQFEGADEARTALAKLRG